VAECRLEKKRILKEITQAYDSAVVRRYAQIRFIILHQRFLDEIGQYLPSEGIVLDVGCGFGLFALYFAGLHPHLQIRGIDYNPRRVAMAQNAARRLGLNNVEFKVGDARDFSCAEKIRGAYMLDLIHHIPPASARELVAEIAGHLAADGRLIVKDIEPTPYYKKAFTWLLDKLMDFRAPVNYWAVEEMQEMLGAAGFRVYKHSLMDYLPYPHVIYIAEKRQAGQEMPHSPGQEAAQQPDAKQRAA
jgi:2-polyprenyl-3-methyl-5-hydroxy-6-metoxy-1,4-benzoquinol methylase